MTEPYYEDDFVRLYHGDMRDLIPRLWPAPRDLPDLIVADPPYGETPLEWDKWPDGWPSAVAHLSRAMWCFGSFRMFMTHRNQITDAGWRLSQDVVWEKQNSTGFDNDRFTRSHELVTFWYQGNWNDLYHEVPMALNGDTRRVVVKEHRANRAQHKGNIGPVRLYVRENGERNARSVLLARNMQGLSIHPTEKPVGILDPLISYACPEGGLVFDPLCGSAATLETARMLGRRAIGIEACEEYAEVAAMRLSGVSARAIKEHVRRRGR